MVAAAVDLIDLALDEREKRLRSFLEERGASLPAVDRAPAVGPCPLPLSEGDSDHVAWVQGLGADTVAAGEAWAGASGPRW